MLTLDNVTLWAICWSDAKHMYARTLRVLRWCQKHINFERVVWFVHLPTTAPGIEIVQIPKLDMAQFNIFVNRTVPLVLGGDYAMSVHEDGFPIDFSMWSDEFLAYDYIGAPWRDGVVGNGGFNIESRRMMDAKLTLPFSDTTTIPASDVYLCRLHRADLEARGLRFAPRDVAMRFSTEQIGWPWPSFGFHSRLGTPCKYAIGWNLILTNESDCAVHRAT